MFNMFYVNVRYMFLNILLWDTTHIQSKRKNESIFIYPLIQLNRLTLIVYA